MKQRAHLGKMLVAIICSLLILPLGMHSSDVSAISYGTVTHSSAHISGAFNETYGNRYFTIDIGGVSFEAVCGHLWVDGPKKGEVVTLTEPDYISKQIAYWGYLHPKQHYIVHQTISDYWFGVTTATMDRYGTTISAVRKQSAALKVPENFKVYKGVKPGIQELLIWKMIPPPPQGKAKIKKVIKSNSHLVAECSENYTLAGAVYGIYKNDSDAKADRNRVLTLTTDSSGNSKEATILEGDYIAREIIAPRGFVIDKTPYPVHVSGGKTTEITSADEPMFDPMGIKVNKKAADDLGKSLSLEGAEYMIRYYKELKVPGTNKNITSAEELTGLKPYKSWVVKTDKNGLAMLDQSWLVEEKSDNLFISESGRPAWLLGTYSIEEVKAPSGFVKSDMIWVQQASFDSHLQHVTSQLKDITDFEKSQTVSITLNKVDAETGMSKPQGYGTLKGAEYDLMFYDPLKLEEIKIATLITDENGFAKFSGGRPGLYKLRETKASNGYIKDPKYHEIKAEILGANTATFNYKVASKEKPVTVKIEKNTVNEKGETITLSGASLQLLDKNKKVIEDFTSKETAHVIKGLTPGKYYIREITPPDKYLPLDYDVEFTVKETSDVQKVKILNEPVPEIKTYAYFSNGLKNSKPGKNLKIQDTMSYKNVMAGREYIVKGEVVNKKTGKTLAKAETKFKADKTSGQINLEFKLDASKLKGVELVVVEKLYKVHKNETTLVAEHTDLNDTRQIINIPNIKTNAGDMVDGGKDLNASKNQVVKDRVTYENLYPNKEYTVKGMLMYKNTGKPVYENGKIIIAKKTFKAEKTNGFIDIEFKLDASSLKGESVVVFERLYENDIEIGFHCDLNDEKQTVNIPQITTKAISKIDEQSRILPLQNVIISDKVEYRNLIAGQNYRLKGTLVNKKSKVILAKASSCFIPKEKDGEVVLDFLFDARELKGQDVVVFEELFKIDENGKSIKETAEHADLEDKNQTVTVENPKLRTSAEFSGGKKEMQANECMKLVDTVYYENLMPGKEYIVKGILIDKSSQKPFISNGSEVSVEHAFVAEKSKGHVELTFIFDGSGLNNRDLVVFENIYHGEDCIATHADINDKNQTIKVTALPPVKTGDVNSIRLYLIAILSAVGILKLMKIRRKYK